MRTNGFIFLAVGLTAAALAGPTGYLPNVGPIALRFAPEPKPRTAFILPPSTGVATNNLAREDFVAEISSEPPPLTVPTPPLADPLVLPPNVVISTNMPGPLIGAAWDTNNVFSPQVFMRFFTPLPGGNARETVVIPAPGFSPAQPPPSSSTATYRQIKP